MKWTVLSMWWSPELAIPRDQRKKCSMRRTAYPSKKLKHLLGKLNSDYEGIVEGHDVVILYYWMVRLFTPYGPAQRAPVEIGQHT